MSFFDFNIADDQINGTFLLSKTGKSPGVTPTSRCGTNFGRSSYFLSDRKEKTIPASSQLQQLNKGNRSCPKEHQAAQKETSRAQVTGADQKLGAG